MILAPNERAQPEIEKREKIIMEFASNLPQGFKFFEMDGHRVFMVRTPIKFVGFMAYLTASDNGTMHNNGFDPFSADACIKALKEFQEYLEKQKCPA